MLIIRAEHLGQTAKRTPGIRLSVFVSERMRSPKKLNLLVACPLSLIQTKYLTLLRPMTYIPR